MTSRLVYPFAFLLRQHDLSRRVRAFQIRDGAATLEIVTALARLGWEYGGLLLNYPPLPNEEPKPGETSPTLYKVAVPAGPGDLIFTATRPPRKERGKKRVNRGWTDLEALVLDAWKPYFDGLNRREVLLARELHAELGSGYEDRSHIFFFALEGSRYCDLDTCRYRGKPRTAAFLLRLPELWPGGPGYLGIFGMDGTTTLIWAHLLRTRHSDLLEEPGFVMVELEMGTIPERTTDLGFAQGWQANVILRHRL